MSSINVLMDSLHLNRNLSLTSLLNKREKHLPKAKSLSPAYWAPKAYGLHNVSVFQDAGSEQQAVVLSKLSRSRLEEAYHIEKAGIAFGAKMILESTTFEERKMYAHFTGEESEHLGMIESYLDSISNEHLSNSFLLYLSETIKSAPKNVLVFIIQVILEGWGIEHYSDLARNCQDPQLAQTLKKIVQDEAGHHGSGVLLFDEQKLSAAELEQTHEALITFLNMVRVGPYALISTLIETLKLSPKDVLQALEELKAVEETNRKLATLRSLALKSGAKQIVARADELGLFQVAKSELISFYEVQ